MPQWLRLLLVVLLLAGLGFVAWLMMEPGSESIRSWGPLVIHTPGGVEVDLATNRDQVQVLHFWATWCAPCIEEMPVLSDFWTRYEDRQNAVLYAIAVDDEGWETVGPFVEKYGFDLPFHLDRGAVVSHRFGTTKFPETWVIDAKGRPIRHFVGPQDWKDPAIVAWFDQIL